MKGTINGKIVKCSKIYCGSCNAKHYKLHGSSLETSGCYCCLTDEKLERATVKNELKYKRSMYCLNNFIRTD